MQIPWQCVLVCQSGSTLCGPVDCNPSISSVHRISQARMLEWVAIFSSRGSSPPGDQVDSLLLNHLGSPRGRMVWLKILADIRVWDGKYLGGYRDFVCVCVHMHTCDRPSARWRAWEWRNTASPVLWARGVQPGAAHGAPQTMVTLLLLWNVWAAGPKRTREPWILPCVVHHSVGMMPRVGSPGVPVAGVRRQSQIQTVWPEAQ